MYHYFFNQSLRDGYLDCFQYFALTNNAAMNNEERRGEKCLCKGCIILHFQQQCEIVPVFTLPPQLYVFRLFNVANMIGH